MKIYQITLGYSPSDVYKVFIVRAKNCSDAESKLMKIDHHENYSGLHVIKIEELEGNFVD